MPASASYDVVLAALPPEDLRSYLLEHSGLPGPRSNLELAHALARSADTPLASRLAADPEEYVRCCGVLALGPALARSDPPSGPEARALLGALHSAARSDSWRVREMAATALQLLGDVDPGAMADVVRAWARQEDCLVRRAAVAGICEPRLLATAPMAALALDTCRTTTRGLLALEPPERRRPEARTLRKALAYCWSVAVAADPTGALPAFRELEACGDPDAGWIVRQNLTKARLRRVLA